MDPLNYSSKDASELNTARRKLWVAKYMLGQSNSNTLFSSSRWMSELNRARAALKRVAREIRAQQEAR